MAIPRDYFEWAAKLFDPTRHEATLVAEALQRVGTAASVEEVNDDEPGGTS